MNTTLKVSESYCLQSGMIRACITPERANFNSLNAYDLRTVTVSTS